jgi:hypothetical protein
MILRLRILDGIQWQEKFRTGHISTTCTTISPSMLQNPSRKEVW